MGYRSQVAVVLNKENGNELIDLLKQNNFDYMADDAEIKENENYLLLLWDWVKWYEWFEDVKFIEQYIGDKDCLFLRIGEELDDVEETLYGEDYDMFDIVRITRTLTIKI